ncbi:uncharacterized protein LOC17888575 isoform X2 [Capsella rubella]|uniref:uncharacterized protein LOC17888575 isoform X2 n=1 Tax=Capsella rubella TaxID=81985 RepID=UPI000CD5C683|nr:uncharacterized protein LOC17888575 isoform X2 [Capsella rubella]
MQSTPLGTTAVSPVSVKLNSYGRRLVPSSGVSNFSLHRRERRHSSSLSPMVSISHALSKTRSGACNASQIVDIFPAVSPEIVVREARLEDCWEVAETHCSSFFPGYSFPLDVVLRVDRLMAMVMGFSVPPGCRRTCLVAVIGSSADETICFGSEDFKIGAFDAKISLNKGYVAGILTVDTVADYLPRKGPLRQRRFDGDCLHIKCSGSREFPAQRNSQETCMESRGFSQELGM